MTPPVEIDKHEEFWFESGDLVLLVDGVYFKVHRDVLAQSCGLIKDMLSIPQQGQPSEGSSPEHPVPIHEVTFDDMEVIIRDAYNRLLRTGTIVEARDSQGIVRLLRAAHRMQSWNVAVLAATAAMKQLPAIDRFMLCRDLDLDSIRDTLEVEREQEEVQRVEIHNKRAAARGLPIHESAARNTERTASDWLATAVSDVILSKSVVLPLAQFDDKLNLRLALARIAVAEERHKRFNAFLDQHEGGTFFATEMSAAVAGLDVHQENASTWYNEMSQIGRYSGMRLEELKTVFLTEKESKAVVLNLWSQPGF